jgi:threonine/homoserine/homoserine lactone efflux protein
MDIAVLPFAAISAVVIVTPGPDTALTIRNVLVGGRSAGVATALGVVAGQATWAMAASAGVVSILLASEALFQGVKMVGALYLIYLGARSLWAALRSGTPIESAPGSPGLSRAAAFRQGLISNLANPKMAVFFASILPQFAPRHGSVFATLLALGAMFCAMTLAWLSLYSIAVGRLRDVFDASRVRRALETLAGATLVALGVRLASSER